MHCWIYEVSDAPLAEDERITSEELPRWFMETVAEFVRDAGREEREGAIQQLTRVFRGLRIMDDERLCFAENAKQAYFEPSYVRFREAAEVLAKTDFASFSGEADGKAFADNLHRLNRCCEDPCGSYVYDHQEEKLITMDQWVRSLDISKAIYIGAVIDYHN